MRGANVLSDDGDRKIHASKAKPEENLFKIMDQLVYEVHRTKNFVIIMILVVIVAIPVIWHAAPLVTGTPFILTGFITIGIAAIFLIIGIRQWIVLAKWTKRYHAYKELQSRVDKQLDFESEEPPGSNRSA